MVRVDGAMVLLGVPPEPTPVSAFSLIFGRRSLGGSLIGGIKETQEMLDFCAEHGVTSDIELFRSRRSTKPTRACSRPTCATVSCST